MPTLRRTALAALLLVGAGCAAPPAQPPPETPGAAPPPPPPARAEPALPPNHGWIELALRDRNVPADPAYYPPQPPSCELEVHLDGVPVAMRLLRPTGTAAPYSVTTSLRVPAGAGWHDATITYARCRAFRGQLDSLEARIRLAVAPGAVTTIRYDGSRVTASPPRPRPAFE